jgi:hypothetical protein
VCTVLYTVLDTDGAAILSAVARPYTDRWCSTLLDTRGAAIMIAVALP